jgi:hypothetical protein
MSKSWGSVQMGNSEKISSEIHHLELYRWASESDSPKCQFLAIVTGNGGKDFGHDSVIALNIFLKRRLMDNVPSSVPESSIL